MPTPLSLNNNQLPSRTKPSTSTPFFQVVPRSLRIQLKERTFSTSMRRLINSSSNLAWCRIPSSAAPKCQDSRISNSRALSSRNPLSFPTQWAINKIRLKRKWWWCSSSSSSKTRWWTWWPSTSRPTLACRCSSLIKWQEIHSLICRDSNSSRTLSWPIQLWEIKTMPTVPSLNRCSSNPWVNSTRGSRWTMANSRIRRTPLPISESVTVRGTLSCTNFKSLKSAKTNLLSLSSFCK